MRQQAQSLLSTVALLYPPSEQSETSRYAVFTFLCLCACLCALSPVFNRVNWRNDVLFVEKCIRLVREKLTIFPYGQYIVGIYVSLAF